MGNKYQWFVLYCMLRSRWRARICLDREVSLNNRKDYVLWKALSTLARSFLECVPRLKCPCTVFRLKLIHFVLTGIHKILNKMQSTHVEVSKMSLFWCSSHWRSKPCDITVGKRLLYIRNQYYAQWILFHTETHTHSSLQGLWARANSQPQ